VTEELLGPHRLHERGDEIRTTDPVTGQPLLLPHSLALVGPMSAPGAHDGDMQTQTPPHDALAYVPMVVLDTYGMHQPGGWSDGGPVMLSDRCRREWGDACRRVRARRVARSGTRLGVLVRHATGFHLHQ
jgi:hypothetical protein